MVTLLIDADDTLWENIAVFNAVNAAYVEWILPNTTMQEIQSDLDALQVEFIEQHGYGRDTFQRSLIAGVERFGGRPASESDIAYVAELLRPLRWESLDIIPGVIDALAELQHRRQLILVTKGDHHEQSHKVDRSGLRSHFEAIEILPEKTVDAYSGIVETHKLNPASTWMVGNSPRSDILPALEAGIGAVHIPHAETWSHEHGDLVAHPRLLQLNHFAELVRHF
ncbi:MAG: putative hydrolase of the HAD superfamily [Verrucomicrobiales bacterium]